MENEVNNIKNEAIAQIIIAKGSEELENIMINYLGRNGKLTKLIKNIKNLPEIERKSAGAVINESKNLIISSIAQQKNKLKNNLKQWFDPTIPGINPTVGKTHLISRAIEDITRIFEKIGFNRVRYPEVEWDWYAFTGLNFPKDHPARDDWETFFIDKALDKKMGPLLLTPHTSSGQLREMERIKKPPIRMINIAKCYRRQSDASHYPMFHQFEGLVIDKNINISNLKGTLDYFATSFFGKHAKTRIRPYDFVFTEPSFEVDISCCVCFGKGCKLCKGGWLEIGGAGMVHPNVLKNGKIDPKIYSGFAFGWGVERVLMMKPGLSIPDLRILYSTDLRILNNL